MGDVPTNILQFMAVQVWEDPDLHFYFIPPAGALALWVWKKELYDGIHWEPSEKTVNGKRVYGQRYTCNDFFKVYHHGKSKFVDCDQVKVLDITLFSDEYVVNGCWLWLTPFFRTLLCNFAQRRCHPLQMTIGNLDVRKQWQSDGTQIIGYIPILECM